jgi:ceramide glucosyltransferase
VAVANQLADDYRLGELTRRLGLRTVLSDLVVEVCVAERSFEGLVRHELRWLRTIRALRPIEYAFCFVTFCMPVAALGAALSGGRAAGGMFAITVAARIMLHIFVRKTEFSVLQFAIVPLRDALSLCLWVWSFATRSVHWRDDRYWVGRDGTVQRVAGTAG